MGTVLLTDTPTEFDLIPRSLPMSFNPNSDEVFDKPLSVYGQKTIEPKLAGYPIKQIDGSNTAEIVKLIRDSLPESEHSNVVTINFDPTQKSNVWPTR